MIETINKLMRDEKQLVQEIRREPSPRRSGRRSAPASGSCPAVLKMAQQPISLQSPVGESEETNFGDFIEDRGRRKNPSDMTPCFAKEKLRTCWRRSPTGSGKLLEQRFGLIDVYSRTLEEVGRQFQVTRERIRQIEAKPCAKWRPSDSYPQLEGFLEAPESKVSFFGTVPAQLPAVQLVQLTGDYGT